MISADEIIIDAGGVPLGGMLTRVAGAQGLVVFVHGSGSSRFSPRNRSVAEFLNAGGLSTLLFDLLTPAEHDLDSHTRALRFDIGLLTERLVATLDWLATHGEVAHLPIGLFGASTGAAAALAAAAQRPRQIAAVVSRGGRPDLARSALTAVQAPTLLLVGGLDREVIKLNRAAAARVPAPCQLEIVPGASHLFEEPGTLADVARLARDWFQRHLAGKCGSEAATSERLRND